MRYKVMSIRDRVSETYSQPMFFATVGAAIRAFSDEVKRSDNNNNLNKHPEDFDLFQVGEFDDNSGEFEPMRPQQVTLGKDHV